MTHTTGHLGGRGGYISFSLTLYARVAWPKCSDWVIYMGGGQKIIGFLKREGHRNEYHLLKIGGGSLICSFQFLGRLELESGLRRSYITFKVIMLMIIQDGQQNGSRKSKIYIYIIIIKLSLYSM